MSGSRRCLAVLLMTLPVLAACAKREPPSGGPPDLDPPRVLATAPDSGVARVPIDSPISITFSESMEPRTTQEAVSLKPAAPIAKHRWDHRTLTLLLAEPLLRNQTYTLAVDGSARDRHGNILGVGVTRVFSTADSFPPGRLEGEVEGRGLAAEGIALWCYVAGRAPDSTARDFDALGLVDGRRAFRVDGLAVPNTYRLWAFADLNHNRSFEPATDVLAPIDTLLALTVEHPVATGLKLVVVNPRTPGRVRGTVLDSLADSSSVLRVLAVADSDTTRRVVTTVEEDATFEIKLDSGSWTLRAFRDLDKNQIWQPGREPASAPLKLTILPASDLLDVEFRIRPGSP